MSKSRNCHLSKWIFFSFLIVFPCLAIAFDDDDDCMVPGFESVEQFANLKASQDFVIGGLINPLSCQPYLHKVDLTAKGVQNVTLTRLYLPFYMRTNFLRGGQLPFGFSAVPMGDRHEKQGSDRRRLFRYLETGFRSWTTIPHRRLEIVRRNPLTVRLTDPSGATFDYALSSSGETSLVSKIYGISNAAYENPSGRYDPRNTKIHCEEGENRLVAHLPTGRILHYRKECNEYLLDKEVLPNGKVLKYQYTGADLSTIESMDPSERHVYASIRIEGHPDQGKQSFTTHTGLTATYEYAKNTEKLTYRNDSGRKKTKFFTSPAYLTKVSTPHVKQNAFKYTDRFLLQDLEGQDQVFSFFLCRNISWVQSVIPGGCRVKATHRS